MSRVSRFFVFVALFAMVLMSWTTACSNNTNTGNENPGTETGGGDGGTNKDTPGGKPDDVPAGPITITFDPASGEIDVKDVCITVKMSGPPKKLVKAEFQEDGSSTAISAGLSYDTEDKSKMTAKACPFALLTQGVKYTLKVEVLGRDDKPYMGSAEYTTKKPYADDEPAKAGLAVNMKIDKITTPDLLNSLLEGQKDAIPAILLTVHQRDDGKKGNLTLVGGLGKNGEAGKPATVDTETPVSLALQGRFEGRWFAVGPTTFVLSVAGISIRLDDFSLTGIFSQDGTTIEHARLTAIIDPEVVKQQFSMDICAIVDCDEGPDGKKSVRIAGNLTGEPNPLGYSAFITDPVYLGTDFDPAGKITFYTTSDTKAEDVTVKLSTCTGSQKEDKPCSTSDGATVTEVTEKGTVTIDDTKKKGEYAPPTLTAATWYKMELEAKSEAGDTFKTFVTFKTK